MSKQAIDLTPQPNFRQVLQPTPFHQRMVEHCPIQNWMSWNGYQTPRVCDQLASEYFAIRSTCSVMDLTPMEKYRIIGPDAVKFLNRLVTRDISGLKPGRVTYVIWCNDEGITHHPRAHQIFWVWRYRER